MSEQKAHSLENQTEKEFLTKLIDDHWKYIEGVLNVGGAAKYQISNIEYHYKTSFEHGWKHAKEYFMKGV